MLSIFTSINDDYKNLRQNMQKMVENHEDSAVFFLSNLDYLSEKIKNYKTEEINILE